MKTLSWCQFHWEFLRKTNNIKISNLKVDFPTAFMQNPTSQPSTILKLLQLQGGRTNASASVRCLRVPQTLDVSSLHGAASRESWIVMDPIGKLHNKIILDDFMIRSIYIFLLFPSVHCCFKQNTSEFLKKRRTGTEDVDLPFLRPKPRFLIANSSFLSSKNGQSSIAMLNSQRVYIYIIGYRMDALHIYITGPLRDVPTYMWVLYRCPYMYILHVQRPRWIIMTLYVTSLERWLVKGIIPKWPCFNYVQVSELP